MPQEDLKALSQKAMSLINNAKRRKEQTGLWNTDLCEPTDTLLVLPIAEEAALLECVYYTLEHSSNKDFPPHVRKNMLRVLNRLTPSDT